MAGETRRLAYAEDDDPSWLHRAFRYTTERSEVVERGRARLCPLTGKRVQTTVTRVVRGGRKLVAYDTRIPNTEDSKPLMKQAPVYVTVVSERRGDRIYYRNRQGVERSVPASNGRREVIAVQRTPRVDGNSNYRVLLRCAHCKHQCSQGVSHWSHGNYPRCPKCQRSEWSTRPMLLPSKVSRAISQPKMTDGGSV